MSISTATDRPASPRRVQPPHVVGALLLAIGLIAVVVAIAISSTTSSAGRVSARPDTINTTRSHPTPEPTSVSDTNLAGGPSRAPATHAPFPVGTPPAPQAERAEPTGVSDTNLAGGLSRGTGTHAPLPIGTPPAPQAEPGPGHR
jgi:hypothetical protein